MTDVRLGTDLDAVPVANATERTAPTWEARALAAEARLAALPEEIAAAIRAFADDNQVHVETHTGLCSPIDGDRCDITAAYRHAAAIAEAQP